MPGISLGLKTLLVYAVVLCPFVASRAQAGTAAESVAGAQMGVGAVVDTATDGQAVGGAGVGSAIAFARITPAIHQKQMERLSAFALENDWQPLPPDSLRVVDLLPELEFRMTPAATALGVAGVWQAFEVNLKTGQVTVLSASGDVPKGFTFRLHPIYLETLYDILESAAYQNLAAEGGKADVYSNTYLVESDLHGEYRWRLYPSLEFVPEVARFQMVLPFVAKRAYENGEHLKPLTPEQLAVQAIFPKIMPGRRYSELERIARHAESNYWLPLATDRLRVVDYSGFANRVGTGFEVNLQTGEVTVLAGQHEQLRVRQFTLKAAELEQLLGLIESESFIALRKANDIVGLDGYSLLVEADWQGQYRWRLHWGRIPAEMTAIHDHIRTAHRSQD